MATKVKGEAIKESSIPLSALDDNLKSEFNCKYGLSGIVTVLNSNNTTSDIFPIGEYFVYVSSKKTIIKLNIGGQTNLSQLNGPSVIITSEVISGSKVKFSVSGGDISFYGNLIIGNKYNEVSIPTPDWDAQEGEAGYIKNKPVYNRIDFYENVQPFNFTNEQAVEQDWNKFSLDVGTEYQKSNAIDCVCDIIIDYKGDYTVGGGSFHQNITRNEKLRPNEYKVIDETSSYSLRIRWIPDSDGGDMFDGYIEFEVLDESGEGANATSIEITGKVTPRYGDVTPIPLTSDFLDTVVKTTPQTLTDTDKNQALANLGIDPVVWQYMCEPYVYSEGTLLPSDLRSIIEDEDGYLNNLTFKVLLFQMTDENDDMIVLPIESITAGNGVNLSNGATFYYSAGEFI